MGAFDTNDAEVGGSACEFLAAGKTKTGNAAEVWVLAAGDGRSSPIESGNAVSPDICGQATGDRGGVGGPAALFLMFVQ